MTLPLTVPAALDAAAERDPTGEAVADGDVRLTWAALRSRVRAFAGFLSSHGVGTGARVAVCSPNTWHWVVAGLGILYAGATLVPVSTRFTARETLDVLSRARLSGLVITGRFLGTSRLAALDSLPPLVVRVPVEAAEPPVPGVVEWSDVDGTFGSAAVTPDDVSDILFTSGTTGRSKGAMSAHRQALGVAAAWASCAGLSPGDRYLVVNPFFHSFGYKAGILACVLTGATIVPQRVFDASSTLRLIEQERITVLPAAPTVYRMLLDAPDRSRRDLSSLRLAVTGAASVPAPLVARMHSDLGFDTVLTAYGLTEAVVATMSSPTDSLDVVSHFSGRPTGGFEIRLGDHDEILLRGPNVMLGYLDDPAATAAAIDPAGWLHTGDVGSLSADGHLRITDRLKDIYVSGGFNVYPAEVEQVLATHPAIADSAVVGLPDTRLGEVGRAYIVPHPGAGLTAEAVLAYCKENLANYKVPRSVEFVPALPRNPSGKVLKRLLRETPMPDPVDKATAGPSPPQERPHA
ncbi:FadD3 family acyl-CoA ligase [Amycolatopsis sp. DSM 110486]|uniref:FadD3 family acyl-CoA ligase n=1 Tax=Amycolatopsis sp. DSM 110486 TaxID=2865832 RepID=UPI001C69BB02|nr:FadD3 family acyl-CoA ligase [Amycolatopsis sp. DSM 110486]QYN17196.1 FadD3 family acyl-CoA ligase [Amycolatopsis sp. DSM 110486]